MNNATMNREQFNEPISQQPFYAIRERLNPFKKIAYPASESAIYHEPHQVNYPISAKKEYQKAKVISYPVAKGLISHTFKRRKLI